MTSIDDALFEKVENAIQQIRPFLEADGGNIKLIEITNEMIAKVQLIGSCRDCSMSQFTMKNGVEESIRRNVPEIKQVVTID